MITSEKQIRVEYCNGFDWIRHPFICEDMVDALAIAKMKEDEGNEARIVEVEVQN